LGINVAKSTVEKYQVRPWKPLSLAWKAFLKNHAQDLVSLDFFVVPTVTHKVLSVLLLLAHERRRVVHASVAEHPAGHGPHNWSSTSFHGTRHRGISYAI
jgi:putative transposase